MDEGHNGRKEGRDEGHDRRTGGRKEGRDKGYNGRKEGRDGGCSGRTEGRDEGHNGRTKGRKEGSSLHEEILCGWEFVGKPGGGASQPSTEGRKMEGKAGRKMKEGRKKGS